MGTAGWSVARTEAEQFPAEGTGLERYSGRFDCAEINSSFHRSHRAETWDRWAGSVPEDFRFSVKLAKTITHQQRLIDCEPLLDLFLEEAARLGPKLAIILIQLPPSLSFDSSVASAFFDALRSRTPVRLACEPRHASWFEEEADRLLQEREIARVAADPARVEAAAIPGGWRGLAYYRLHGSPVPYRSSYDDGRLEAYAERMAADLDRDLWCIFDNTASSAATGDALKLQRLLAART
ncbi:MAG TPA: DUF72 domain-containing protein [Allosphingosinicella sp.]|nr:DUF72 domain-containing protein [Allosphingosinicella sp.]